MTANFIICESFPRGWSLQKQRFFITGLPRLFFLKHLSKNRDFYIFFLPFTPSDPCQFCFCAFLPYAGLFLELGQWESGGPRSPGKPLGYLPYKMMWLKASFWGKRFHECVVLLPLPTEKEPSWRELWCLKALIFFNRLEGIHPAGFIDKFLFLK